MTGNTHIALGVATSLAVMHPNTIPECICAISGGMIGSFICDIDQPGKKNSLDYRDDPYAWQLVVYLVIGLSALLGIDYLAGGDIVPYVIAHRGTPLLPNIIAASAFIAICVAGSHTAHRTFMHSIIALIILTVLAVVAYYPIAIPFALGFLSHIVIDVLNKTDIKYLWPLPIKGFSLGLCDSDGMINDILCGVATVISFILCVYFSVINFSTSQLYNTVHTIFSMPVHIGALSFTFFPLYMISINAITFLIYSIDSRMWIRGLGPYSGSNEDAEAMAEFLSTLYLIPVALGGMIGEIIAVFISGIKLSKGQKDGNFMLFLIPFSVLIIWITAYVTFLPVTVPVGIIRLVQSYLSIPTTCYAVAGHFAIINVITFIAFSLIGKMAPTIGTKERILLVLEFIGGSFGAYLAIKFTGKHKGAIMLSYALPLMMVTHSFVLICSLYNAGIIPIHL